MFAREAASTSAAATEKTESTGIVKLSEKEIFGFVWNKTDKKSRIKDDQIISRQLTEFFQNVKCLSFSEELDGLMFRFSNKPEYETALSNFCSPVPTKAQLAQSPRKFTLIPSRGCYGLFCVKRVRPEDLTLFGCCKSQNSTLWFPSKMDLLRILRDPVITKLYPGMYIDCRNIFILRSVKMNRRIHENLSKAVISKRKESVASTSPESVNFSSKFEKVTESIEKEDSSILKAVSSPSFKLEAACTQFPTLLTELLPGIAKSGLARFRASPGPLLEIAPGKFGFQPSARLVRNGYKQYETPSCSGKSGSNADLFLEDKDTYRRCGVAAWQEAALLIKNLSNGSEVPGISLREKKMRRVELDLKKKLGFDVMETSKLENNDRQENRIESKEIPDFSGKDDCSTNNAANHKIGGKYLNTKGDQKGEIPVERCNIDPSSNDSKLVSHTLLYILNEDQDSEANIFSLHDDILWFETPVSVLKSKNEADGRMKVEFKMKSKEITDIILQGLKYKYPGLGVAESAASVDMVADSTTGLYILSFMDKRKMMYRGTVDYFSKYAENRAPFICKGLGTEGINVGFISKEEALVALRENLTNENFPGLHVAPSCRI